MQHMSTMHYNLLIFKMNLFSVSIFRGTRCIFQSSERDKINKVYSLLWVKHSHPELWPCQESWLWTAHWGWAWKSKTKDVQAGTGQALAQVLMGTHSAYVKSCCIKFLSPKRNLITVLHKEVLSLVFIPYFIGLAPPPPGTSLLSSCSEWFPLLQPKLQMFSPWILVFVLVSPIHSSES